MPRSTASREGSGSPGPSESDGDALARLEQLLEAQLAPASPPPHTAPESLGQPPKKRKKLQEDSDAVEAQPEPGPAEEAGAEIAFRLFSTQKAPQRVVFRAKSTPPPIVLDTRIRDVDDEDLEQVEARRRAIESIAVDGRSLRLQAKHLPATRPASWRLQHRTLNPASYRALKANPASNLLYLDAALPRDLHLLSPFPVPAPEGTDPPKTPHEGLIVQPPFKDVYARRTTARSRGPKESTLTRESEGKKVESAKKEKVPRLPKRNRAFELGNGTGHGLLRLSAVYPTTSAEFARARVQVGAAKASSSKKSGARGSKARRAREKKRRATGGAA
ncbi:hypothetical protein JCM8202_000737 [Rhodotorula sphaerocarpa]